MKFINKLLSETTGSALKFHRTSSKKKKHLPDGDLRVLSSALDGSTSKYAKILQAWLFVNCLVGLRPCEWGDTEIVKRGKRDVLLVNNAKATNGRSHGKTRTIFLAHFNDNQRQLISWFSGLMSRKKSEGEFESTYHGCRSLLLDIM